MPTAASKVWLTNINVGNSGYSVIEPIDGVMDLVGEADKH